MRYMLLVAPVVLCSSCAFVEGLLGVGQDEETQQQLDKAAQSVQRLAEQLKAQGEALAALRDALQKAMEEGKQADVAALAARLADAMDRYRRLRAELDGARGRLEDLYNKAREEGDRTPLDALLLLLGGLAGAYARHKAPSVWAVVSRLARKRQRRA